MTVFDTGGPQGPPPTSSGSGSEGGGAGLNLDRLRVATDKLIDAVCVGEPWQVSGAQAAWDRTIAEIRERVRTLEAVAEAARAMADHIERGRAPVGPDIGEVEAWYVEETSVEDALIAALAAAGGPDGQ